MAALVVIEDNTIMAMVNDHKFSAIPCLAHKRDVFKAGVGGCGSCAQKRQTRQRDEMARIKACLAGMSAPKKTELKALLGAEQARVVYVNVSGKVVQLTF